MIFFVTINFYSSCSECLFPFENVLVVYHYKSKVILNSHSLQMCGGGFHIYIYIYIEFLHNERQQICHYNIYI